MQPKWQDLIDILEKLLVLKREKVKPKKIRDSKKNIIWIIENKIKKAQSALKVIILCSVPIKDTMADTYDLTRRKIEYVLNLQDRDQTVEVIKYDTIDLCLREILFDLKHILMQVELPKYIKAKKTEKFARKKELENLIHGKPRKGIQLLSKKAIAARRSRNATKMTKEIKDTPPVIIKEIPIRIKKL